MTKLSLRSDQRPAAFWRWALVVVFASLVMVGLLGMHTLSVGHSDPVTAAAVSIEDAHASHVATEATHVPATLHHTGTAHDAGCVDCGSGGMHDALMLACVLGLLVAILWVARPGVLVVLSRGPSIVTFVHAPPSPAPIRPPSLLELSISRT